MIFDDTEYSNDNNNDLGSSEITFTEDGSSIIPQEITVDEELDINSSNPVQNKAIAEAFGDIGEVLELLMNGVSGEIDENLDNESQNPVQNKAIAEAIGNVDALLDYIQGGE